MVVGGTGVARGAPPPCTAEAARRAGGGTSGFEIKGTFSSRCRHLPSLSAGEAGIRLGASLLGFTGC